MPRTFHTMLDLGSNTGSILKSLPGRGGVKKIVQLDISGNIHIAQSCDIHVEEMLTRDAADDVNYPDRMYLRT